MQHLIYASLLTNYGVIKPKKLYDSNNDDPPRPRPSYVPPLDKSEIISSE